MNPQSSQSVEPDPEPGDGRDLGYDEAMRRIIYVALAGSVVIVAYGLGASGNPIIAIAVGLMCAGASLLIGGLAGFLFGVPHVRVPGGSSGNNNDEDSKSASGASDPPSPYTPSTSLEQIADWLTKIIVGVGLVDLRSIAVALDSISMAVQNAMGGARTGNAFALGFILYFAVCGFTFGFLWSRLYLARWFRKADEFRRLRGKISALERRQRNDARALALVLPSSREEELEVPENEIAEFVKGSSQVIRNELYQRVHQESATFNDPARPPRFHLIIAILKGLIASDAGNAHFEYLAELSYAFSRKRPPDIAAANKYLNEAIEMRDRNQRRGWHYYEFRRARYTIQMEHGKLMSAEAVTKVLSDLRGMPGRS